MAHFTEVEKSSLYESVATAIENAILSGDAKQGEKLPSEQSLAEQFGVSRNIVREALKAVKARGLLDVRNGDGTYVARPDFADLGDMFSRVVILSDTAISNFYEIRFALEVKACELAATRATAGDLEALQSIVAETKKGLMREETATALDLQFHLSIANATKNPLFPAFLQPLKGVMTRMFRFAYPNYEGRRDALKCHAEIVEALGRRSPALARQAMTRHLERSETNITHIAHKDSAGADPERVRN